MQEPLLRAKRPYPTQDQLKKIASVSSWRHPYSFYFGACIYIPTMSILYFVHVAFNKNFPPFTSEDMGSMIVQILLVAVGFLPCWAISSLIMWARRSRSSARRRGKRELFRSERDISRKILLVYTVVTILLFLGVIVQDIWRVHHWYGLSLIIGASLFFLMVLWGPSMLLGRRKKRQTQNVGTSFTSVRNYLRKEPASK